MSPPHRQRFHVITPGDHFSPRTGSAIPTVVNGLCSFSASRSTVLVAQGTSTDHYQSADVIEYSAHDRVIPAQRYVDVLSGLLGLRRPGGSRSWRAAVAQQHSWPGGYVFGHNAPQLMRYVDTCRHIPVLYAHNDLLRSYTNREAKSTLSPAERIICVSEFIADRTSARLPGELANRLRVVPNGVDCELFHPATPRPTLSEMTVLFIGRMVPDKGPDLLIRAATLANRADIRLVLLGSQGFDSASPLSGYERNLRRLVEGTVSAVEFRPFAERASVPGLLQSADVLVVPSNWQEPSALTIGEGMATGIPVVASAVGGIPESLGDAGILVPPNDPAALAEVLVDLADHPEKRAAIGALARQRALSRDWAWSSRLLEQALRD